MLTHDANDRAESVRHRGRLHGEYRRPRDVREMRAGSFGARPDANVERDETRRGPGRVAVADAPPERDARGNSSGARLFRGRLFRGEDVTLVDARVRHGDGTLAEGARGVDAVETSNRLQSRTDDDHARTPGDDAPRGERRRHRRRGEDARTRRVRRAILRRTSCPDGDRFPSGVRRGGDALDDAVAAQTPPGGTRRAERARVERVREERRSARGEDDAADVHHMRRLDRVKRGVVDGRDRRGVARPRLGVVVERQPRNRRTFLARGRLAHDERGADEHGRGRKHVAERTHVAEAARSPRGGEVRARQTNQGPAGARRRRRRRGGHARRRLVRKLHRRATRRNIERSALERLEADVHRRESGAAGRRDAEHDRRRRRLRARRILEFARGGVVRGERGVEAEKHGVGARRGNDDIAESTRG